MRRPRILATVLSALVALAGLSGCGGAPAAAGSARPASLVLDFTPNAVHAGIYLALSRGYDRSAGVRLHVVIPSASTDAIRLLDAGRVQFAILDIHDLAIARERGAPLVGVMAIVERPLASVIAAPAVHDPAQLQGRTVGVTGAPSDAAVLRSIVAGAGGEPARVHTVTIGFDAVADLLTGRVAAATAFWSDEGVTIQRRRRGFHVFRVDAYGAPSYPELVLCTSASEVRARPHLVRAVVRALQRGYGAVLANPGAGQRALEARVSGLDPSLVSPELHALLSAWRGPGKAIGTLDEARLRAWARWEVRFGIVRRVPDVTAMFDPRPAAGG